MTDQTILQETLDNNIVDGDWLIYWKTSTGVQRRVARSSLLGATLTGAGTIATGGFTLTVPATGTAALKIGTPVANNVAQWDNANAVEDAGFAASNVALLDGSRTLTANWDIGDNRRVVADGVRARDGAGLRLEDDAGNLGVFVEDGGQVGIGTTSPNDRVQIVFSNDNGNETGLRIINTSTSTFGSYAGILTNAENGNVRGAWVTSPTTGTALSGGGMVFRVETDHPMAFQTNNLERMRITNTGDVGIGTTSPGGKLEVDQASATANIPTLHLRQADNSEEFIRFEATVGAGNAIDTAALGTYYGKIRVHVEGVGDKFIALYNT